MSKDNMVSAVWGKDRRAQETEPAGIWLEVAKSHELSVRLWSKTD